MRELPFEVAMTGKRKPLLTAGIAPPGLAVLGLAVLGLVAPGILRPGPATAQPAPRSAAQPATPAPAPAPRAAPEGPDSTQAVFADWTLRCETRPPVPNAPPNSAAPARNCEMVQTAHDQRQHPVAALALGRLTRSEPLKLTAHLPLNVQVATPVRLVLENPGRREAPLALPFRSCTPRGCFAQVELRDEAMLRRLRSHPAEAPARLEWHDPAGGELAAAISFRGFGGAFDALGREE
jgi:invasion protein IalB